MRIKKMVAGLTLLIFVLINSCKPAWNIEIQTDQMKTSFSRSEYEELFERFPENDYCSGLLLEQVLYENGIEVIQSIEIYSVTGDVKKSDWLTYSQKACLNELGELYIGPDFIKPVSIRIIEEELQKDVIRITDIAPTVIFALGLDYKDFPGSVLVDQTYDYVILVFLDGFGFQKFKESKAKGLIPSLAGDGKIYQAVTVYPPRTITGSAAVLTGLMPKENGVDRGGIRKTDAVTLFDLTSENEINSAAVEGESLAFNLRGTEVALSGDRDLNGSTDDNVFANAMEIITTDMPKLLWIHFHGIDDYGHTYGPDDSKIDEKIAEINEYLEQIKAALPKDSLIIYFSDHGMHIVDEEGRLGNHGHLIYEDMVIPVVIQSK